eukprot:GDKJ01021977.1.p1 GENE.GDKJ01021977.1~~GDKJ01021977.1.p1  ORF type:complete len:210 (+),score=28.15 GDKJ01021977.1:87-716(+)
MRKDCSGCTGRFITNISLVVPCKSQSTAVNMMNMFNATNPTNLNVNDLFNPLGVLITHGTALPVVFQNVTDAVSASNGAFGMLDPLNLGAAFQTATTGNFTSSLPYFINGLNILQTGQQANANYEGFKTNTTLGQALSQSPLYRVGEVYFGEHPAAVAGQFFEDAGLGAIADRVDPTRLRGTPFLELNTSPLSTAAKAAPNSSNPGNRF